MMKGGKSSMMFDLGGGADGTRTRGLLNASQALCQLSYSPTKVNVNVRGPSLAVSRTRSFSDFSFQFLALSS